MLLIEVKKATDEWRKKRNRFFCGSLCSKPSLLSDADLDDSAERNFEGSLHFRSTEEQAVQGIVPAWWVISHQPLQKRRRTRAVAGDWSGRVGS